MQWFVIHYFNNMGIFKCRKNKELEKRTKSKKLKTIDLYADLKQVGLFKKLNYKEGSTLVAFRKKFGDQKYLKYCYCSSL